MPTLPLALEIANAVLQASEQNRPLNTKATALQLRHAHPEADATIRQIKDALESVAADNACGGQKARYGRTF